MLHSRLRSLKQTPPIEPPSLNFKHVLLLRAMKK